MKLLLLHEWIWISCADEFYYFRLYNNGAPTPIDTIFKAHISMATVFWDNHKKEESHACLELVLKKLQS